MNKKLAENLRKIRKEHNLSQEQLAEELKVSRQAISKWESGNTYPEMEKILQICNRFNLDINDLLNNDINEIKSEQTSRNNINKYIDDFLLFITKSFNMFMSLNFRTKLKCILEQGMIIALLLIVSVILGNIAGGIFGNIISFLPVQAYNLIHRMADAIMSGLSFVIGILIWLHIFRTRYIDYYEIATENETENITRTELKQEKERIILRDPKHSEYKFINGLLKSFVILFKIIALITVAALGSVLIGLMIGAVMSFLIAKTGFFFLGLLITLTAAMVMTIIVEVILLNFVFNRQNKKKLMIWSFIISLIFIGLGSGLMFIGSLDFELSDDKDLLTNRSFNIEMSDNLVISNILENKVEYIESDNADIRVEYSLNKHIADSFSVDENDEFRQLFIYSDDVEVFRMMKESINYLNNRKVLNQSSRISNIRVYGTRENIIKLKNNMEDLNDHYSTIGEYETRIMNLENKVAEYESEINQLNYELESYRNQNK